MEGKGKVVPVL